MNDKGFTLIELLAVITIMGILMLVAIPNVTRTIENSRRDTFADIAHEYINGVRSNVLADNVECQTSAGSDKYAVASALNEGSYYYEISTDATSEHYNATQDLMESIGKSPFGNAELNGYVRFDKTAAGSGDGVKIITSYQMALVDTGTHGFDLQGESNIKRSTVKTTGATITPLGSDALKCRMTS